MRELAGGKPQELPSFPRRTLCNVRDLYIHDSGDMKFENVQVSEAAE